MNRRSFAVTAGLVPLLAGCSVAPFDAVAEARARAEREFPGELWVVRAAWAPGAILFPALTATYGFVDEPDGAVTIRDNVRLADAYATGREESANFRGLRDAFAAGGFVTLGSAPPPAPSSTTTPPGLITGSIDIDDGGLDFAAMCDRIETVARDWLAGRSRAGLPGVSHVNVSVIPRQWAAGIPAVAPPTLAAYAQVERRLLLGTVAAYQISIGDDARPVAANIGPALPDHTAIRALAARLASAAKEWAAARHPDLAVGEGASWRLESPDRLRSWVTCCAGPTCGRGDLPVGLIALSSTPDGADPRDFRLLLGAEGADIPEPERLGR
ncbi:hypothetical protein [Naumannella huperziae]